MPERTPWEKLGREGRLFLDPCVDDPAEFLDCDNQGLLQVHPEASGDWGKVSAQTTIDLIGLNRTELIKARRERIEEYDRSLGKVEEASALDEEFLSDRAPYALACRRWRLRRRPRMASISPDRSLGVSAVRGSTPAAEPTIRQEPVSVDFSLDAAPKLERLTSYLERIVIENFQPIARLEIEPPTSAVAEDLGEALEQEVSVESTREDPDPVVDGVGWSVVLGENGCGKSSYLKAVALGLVGEEQANALLKVWDVEAGDLQRRVPRSSDEEPAPMRVHLELSGRPHQIIYRLDSEGIHFEKGAEGVSTVVRGYGTSRLPPRRKEGLPDAPPLAKVDNLFDPHATLINAEAWLLEQDDETFERAATALSDLFGLGEGEVYKTERPRQVRVRRGNTREPLSQLSDGYQALTGLVADLMAAVPRGVSDFHEETGIVLLDELGVHLHPRWRMSVVQSLRRAFPRFQFLCTTHEPLCLRGLNDGEVAVMRRSSEGWSMLEEDVPPVRGLRIDQLLTSRHFGLHTTIDPDLDQKFTEYYDLRARQPRGAVDEQRFEQLKRELDPYRALGYTRRDQLVYEFIDDFLAEEGFLEANGRLNSVERRKLKGETKKKVLDVWRRVELANR
ncbi:MAG: AAA family ATPase [Acidobacteriota bacterium]